MRSLLLLLIIAIMLGCKEKSIPTPLKPEEPKPAQKIYDFDTTAYQTKEPWIKVNDKGVEFFMVVYGWDTDNQINGRISQLDADNIRVFDTHLEYAIFPYLAPNYRDSLYVSKYKYMVGKYNLAEKNLYKYSYPLPLVKIHDLGIVKSLKI